MTRHEARMAAVQGMYSWDLAEGKSAEEIGSFEWVENATSDDLVFARYLLSGAIENIREIDKQIKSRLLPSWDFLRLNRVALAVLRISVFSILYQKDISVSIVIDEAIEMARAFGSDDNCKFINGILDKIAKENRE